MAVNRTALPTPFSNQSPPWSLPQLDLNLLLPVSALNDSSLGFVNGIPLDVGVTNSYTITLPYGVPTSYRDGMMVVFLPRSTNTAGTSITVTPLGAASLLNPAGQVLIGGEVSKNRVCAAIYSTNPPPGFRIVGPSPLLKEFGTVTANPPALNCAGATSVYVSAGINTVINLGLSLTSLAVGVPLLVRFFNNATASLTFFLSASDPSGTPYAVFSFEQGFLTRLDGSGTGRVLVSTAQLLLYGHAGPASQLFLSGSLT